MARNRWITPDTTGDENIARCLSVPPNLQPAVNGALQELTNERNWEAVGDMTPAECAEAMTDVLSMYYESECGLDQIFPEQVYWLPVHAVVLTGGAQVFTLAEAFFLNGYYTQSPIAQYDERAFTGLLRNGAYNIYALCQTLNSGGRADIYVDGSDFGTYLEFYSASQISNTVVSTNVDIPTDGIHEISLKMNTKHASSTNYTARLAAVWMKRTGDL